MKRDDMLKVASVLLVLLFTLHLTDDVIHGFEKAGPSILMALPISLVFLCAGLLLAGRRSGYFIMFLGSLLAVGVPYLHMKGKSIGRIAEGSGGFFFIWTLLAMGVIASFAVVLSLMGLWSSWRRPRP